MRKLSLCGTITDKFLLEDFLFSSRPRCLPVKTVQWFEPLLEQIIQYMPRNETRFERDFPTTSVVQKGPI